MTAKHSQSNNHSPERGDRIAQANQIMGHLKTQLAELDRREQHLNQQLTTLLNQQRSVQKETERSQTLAQELNELKTSLRHKRVDLEAREQHLNDLEQQLKAEREELNKEKSDFEASQTNREQIQLKASQSLAERELRVGQHELSARNERSELDQLRIELQRAQQECAANQTRLTNERQAFESQRKEFEEHQTAITTQLNDRERATKELEIEVDGRLETVTERERSVLSDEKVLKTEQSKLAELRQTLKDDVGKEVEKEREEVAHRFKQLDSQLRTHEQRVADWQAQVKTEQTKHLTELVALRKEKLTGLDQRENELKRREIDIEKRRQFHEKHLDKLRFDLNSQKVELERERQQQRVWKQQVEESIRLRLAHMRRFRELIAMREDALQTEQSAFQKARVQTEMSLLQLRERLIEDRNHWSQQRASDIQRLTKRDMYIDNQLDSLDQTRRELDQLRNELQSGLNNFVTSFQSAAQSNEESAEPSNMSLHFQSLLQVVGRQCDELEQAQHQLTKRQQKFREEKAAFSSWMDEREELLENRELQIDDDVETLDTQAEHWQAARDQWDSDRQQAEAVIRELVTQLEKALDEIANLQSEGSFGVLIEQRSAA